MESCLFTPAAAADRDRRLPTASETLGDPWSRVFCGGRPVFLLVLLSSRVENLGTRCRYFLLLPTILF